MCAAVLPDRLARPYRLAHQSFLVRGGLDVPDARRLKSLEAETARLKKLVADQALAIDALKEFARGK